MSGTTHCENINILTGNEKMCTIKRNHLKTRNNMVFFPTYSPKHLVDDCHYLLFIQTAHSVVKA